MGTVPRAAGQIKPWRLAGGPALSEPRWLWIHRPQASVIKPYLSQEAKFLGETRTLGPWKLRSLPVFTHPTSGVKVLV